MELFKFALGPYEFFASIIGGIPILIAIFLLYNPALDIQNLILIVQDSFSIQVVIFLSLFSYLLGGLAQGLTWRFFLALCNVFRQDFHYFKNDVIAERDKALRELVAEPIPKALDFEDQQSGQF